MEKNIFLYGALALGMTGMFASCSSDDDIVVNGGGDADATAQVITIAVENAGSGLETRAEGRPLNSSAADQSIENVLLVVTGENNQIAYVKNIADWNTNTVSSVYTENGHGREARFSIPKDDKIKTSGTYNVYAIGYHTGSKYYTTDGQTLEGYIGKLSTTSGQDKITEFTKDLKLVNGVNGDSVRAEEIFAGYNTIKIDPSQSSETTVTLHRQVAGVYTYVKNIPYQKDATKLRLVMVKESKGLVLGEFSPKSPDELQNNGTNNSNNVVNGFDADEKETELYHIRLSEWFEDVKDADGDGLIDGGTNWKGPQRTQKTNRYYGCTFEKGSVYGGEFVIPFLATTTGNYTLKLVLSKEDDTPLQSWSINLPSKDFVTADALNWWNGTAWAKGGSIAGDAAAKYNILRNHLYGVGQRTLNDPGTGTDPDPDPDPEPDDPDYPEDLSKGQTILLRVNSNWEVIHKMDVEPMD